MRRVLLGAVCLALLACESNVISDGSVNGGAGGASGAGGEGGKMPTGAALTIAAGCQPLAPEASCLLPYPSDFFRVADPKLPSGFRTEVTGAAKLLSGDGKNRDASVPGAWAPDGASLTPTLVAVLPGSPVDTGLAKLLGNPLSSSQVISPTLLINAATGALVAHYVDLDTRAKEGEPRAMAIRPFSRLEPRTRYVVAIRGVKGADGTVLPTPEAFRRLRDAEIGKDPSLAAIHPRFEKEVLQVVDALRVDRNQLQLAWDFTTGSEERATGDMLAVRTQTLAYLAGKTPTFTIDEVSGGADPGWRRLRGTLTVPLFLTANEPGALLSRDADGAVKQNGETTVPFSVVIPKSVRDSFEPGRALAYGHGFFGSRGELEGSTTARILERTRAVGFAIDWQGMSSEDLSSLADTLVSRPAHGADFVERVHQSMASWLVLTAAIRGPLAADPALVRGGDGTDEGVVPNPDAGSDGVPDNAGKPLYDQERVAFLGISMGHILGGVHAALNPDVSRHILNVGGAGFTHMMPRALPFVPLYSVISSSLRDPVAIQSYIAMMAEPLDRIDPATYAPLVLTRKLPGSAADRQVLMQTGLGDSAVPNIGSFLHARALGIPLTAPSADAVFGLGEVDPAAVKSAVTLFDFGIDSSGYATGTLVPNKVHDSVRLDPQALGEMDVFLGEGRIEPPCLGPCVGTLLP